MLSHAPANASGVGGGGVGKVGELMHSQPRPGTSRFEVSVSVVFKTMKGMGNVIFRL
jgi:hypothetical protein